MINLQDKKRSAYDRDGDIADLLAVLTDYSGSKGLRIKGKDQGVRLLDLRVIFRR